jgi:hypothetical protein
MSISSDDDTNYNEKSDSEYDSDHNSDVDLCMEDHLCYGGIKPRFNKTLY